MDALSPLFWFLWTTLVCLGLIVLLKAWHTPRHLLELPVIASAMFLFLYGYMAFAAAAYIIPDRLSDVAEQVWDVGQTVPLLSFAALLLGWHLGSSRGRNTANAGPSFVVDYSRVWWLGIFLIVVGTLVFARLRASLGLNEQAYVAGSAEFSRRWEGINKYLYIPFHLIYPGAMLCAWVTARSPAQRTPVRVAFFGLLVLVALYPHLMGARRGPVYPMAISLVYGYYIARRRPPNRAIVTAALGVTAVIMLIFLPVRKYIYHNQSWIDAAHEISLDDVLAPKTKELEDNEFIYNCFMVATIRDTGLYQYGTGYLSLLTHWIPRDWWPEKPDLGSGWFADAGHHVKAVTGYEMTQGASAGGAAEVFNQFGWLSPLFWLAMGLLCARTYRRAVSRDDPRWQMSYVAMLSTFHWMVSQGFAQAFVPGMVYQVAALGVLWLCRSSARENMVGRFGQRDCTRLAPTKVIRSNSPQAEPRVSRPKAVG